MLMQFRTRLGGLKDLLDARQAGVDLLIIQGEGIEDFKRLMSKLTPAVNAHTFDGVKEIRCTPTESGLGYNYEYVRD